MEIEKKRRSSQFLTERNEAASKHSDPASKLQLPVPVSSLMKLDGEAGSKQIDGSKDYLPVRIMLNNENG